MSLPDELHESLTEERVIDAVERTMHDQENLGFCVRCGAEVDGVEPDADRYTCDVCKTPTVFGAENLLLMMARS